MEHQATCEECRFHRLCEAGARRFILETDVEGALWVRAAKKVVVEDELLSCNRSSNGCAVCEWCV